MLGRGYQSCKQGCKAFNNGEFEVAINHFREARGYARNSFTSETENNHYKASTLLAECTVNIADALIQLLPTVRDVGLDKVLANIDAIEKELEEAKANLIDAKQKSALDYRVLQASTLEQIDSFERIFTRVQLQTKKVLINAYWQACDIALATIDADALKIAKMEKCSADLLKVHHDKVQNLISLLKKAMTTAQAAMESKDANEIRDLIIELYEECGDFIPSTENPNLIKVEKEFISFILKQYSEAFHLKRKKPDVTKEELLPLFISVLNVLELKANLERNNPDNAREKIIATCIETIRFHKKFLTPELQKSLSVNDQAEIESYLFSAHRFLSKLFTDPLKKGAHFSQSMKHARNCSKLAIDIKLHADSPLAKDLENAQLYYAKNQFKNAMNILKESGKMTQNTVAIIAGVLGRIHRNGSKDTSQKGFLTRLFNCSPTKLPPSLAMAMDLFLSARKNTTDENILKLCEQNIQLILTEHKKQFDYTYRCNSQQQRPVIGLELSDIAMQKSSAEVKSEFDALIKDYYSNIEVIFSPKSITQAIPGLLKEITRTLTKYDYSQRTVSSIESIAADIEDANKSHPQQAIPSEPVKVIAPTTQPSLVKSPQVTRVQATVATSAATLVPQYNNQQKRVEKRQINEENLPPKKRLLRRCNNIY
jgi:hypothetical protein